MMIAVDAGCLGVSDDRLKVGVYHFAVNLLENLFKIDRKNKYLLYSFTPIPSDVLRKFGSNAVNLVLKPQKGWLSFRLSIEFLLHKPDIFIGLSQSLPLYHPEKSIVFVHDLAFELFPRFYPGSAGRLSRQTKFAVKNSKKIVAVSHCAKNDLVKLYGVKPDKIEVIHHGVNTNLFTIRGVPYRINHAATSEVSLSHTKPYFLFVGSQKPIKNIQNVINAFKLFTEKSNKPYQLIIAGSDYWGNSEIVKFIRDLNLEQKVKITGYVKEADLPRLYSGATAFVSPSFYEGFGMPLVEAMASGTPVITSDRGSIPEVVGDAALLVDPQNTEGLSRAMQKVATDRKLRTQLMEKGLAQAHKFSWQKSARQLFNLLMSC